MNNISPTGEKGFSSFDVGLTACKIIEQAELSLDDQGSLINGKYQAAGIFLRLVTYFLIVGGMLLQKWSHLNNEMLPPDERQPFYLRKAQILSFIFIVVLPGPIEMVALCFTSLTILEPMTAIPLVLIAFGSVVFLGEILTIIDFVAGFFIISGAILSVSFGVHGERIIDVPCLIALFSRSEFIIFQIIILMIIITICGFLIYQRFYRRSLSGDIPKKSSSKTNLMSQESSRSNYSAGSSYTGEVVAEDEEVTVSGSKLVFREDIEASHFTYNYISDLSIGSLSLFSVSIGALTSLFGAQQSAFSKAFAQLVSLSIFRDNQFSSSTTWYIFVAFTILRGLQLYFLNWGLELFDAMVFLPVAGAFEILFGTLTAVVFFDELGILTNFQTFAFYSSCSMTIVGAFLLYGRHKSKRIHILDRLRMPSALEMIEYKRIKHLPNIELSDLRFYNKISRNEIEIILPQDDYDDSEFGLTDDGI